MSPVTYFAIYIGFAFRHIYRVRVNPMYIVKDDEQIVVMLLRSAAFTVGGYDTSSWCSTV